MSHGPAGPVQQHPTSVFNLHIQWIADRQRGDGAVYRIARAAASGEPQIDLLKGRPDMAELHRLRTRWKLGGLPEDRGGMVIKFGLETP